MSSELFCIVHLCTVLICSGRLQVSVEPLHSNNGKRNKSSKGSIILVCILYIYGHSISVSTVHVLNASQYSTQFTFEVSLRKQFLNHLNLYTCTWENLSIKLCIKELVLVDTYMYIIVWYTMLVYKELQVVANSAHCSLDHVSMDVILMLINITVGMPQVVIVGVGGDDQT